MSLGPFPPSPDEHLTDVPREADETLHEYLVRSQHVLVGRIRMLARARDAAEDILTMEHADRRRDRIILTFAGPLLGASAYVGLARAEITEFASQAFITAVIGFAGVTGGPFVLGFAAVSQRLANWLISQRSRHVSCNDRRMR